MSVLDGIRFDWRTLDSGARFKLFPQPPVVTGASEPETVAVSLAPGRVLPGPSDDRMYVRDAIDKPSYYEYPYLPPYEGPRRPDVMPSADGHFDHLEPGSPAFDAAHMYGTVRRVMDIWEIYLGRELTWHFEDDYDRLELIPWIEWDNAQAGYGFIETGYMNSDEFGRVPLALNFDVLAHEFGHTMLYSMIGLPPDDARSSAYAGFHESASDTVAIVAALHFDSVIDQLLGRTSGNLFVRNMLNRIGEISTTKQIRLASNSLRMSDVPDPATPAQALSYPELHKVGEPLTGAVFDILVEAYQELLVGAGLIDTELDALSRRSEQTHTLDDAVQIRFDAAYERNPEGFRTSLIEARDYVGALLARAWSRLSWDLDFVDVGRALLRSDLELTGGHFHPEMLESLVWREIGG
ncbi:MAG: hypothetical protein ACR2RL_16710 [Gammaproteobacteria bacterium]